MCKSNDIAYQLYAVEWRFNLNTSIVDIQKLCSP